MEDLGVALDDFYARKRVLVTGHTGFKGGWLVTWLKMMGASVAGLALAPEQTPSFFSEARIANGMLSVIGDIRDRKAVDDVCQGFQPEIVFHNAAQPLVRRSYADPITTYETNVMGTIRVLEGIRGCKSVRAVVVVTTDKCYENVESLWPYRETDRLGGFDPYSSSKACAEMVVSAYRHSFFSSGMPLVATVRAGNVIGGGDWAEDRIVPDIVRGIAGKKPILIRNPASTRPWQHVLEPLRGYLMLGKALAEGRSDCATAWNFGPNHDGIPVHQLATLLVSVWGQGEIVLAVSDANTPEAKNLRLDSSRAQAILKWHPLLSFEEAVNLTAWWYRTYLANPSCADELTRDQILSYCTRLRGSNPIEEASAAR